MHIPIFETHNFNTYDFGSETNFFLQKYPMIYLLNITEV